VSKSKKLAVKLESSDQFRQENSSILNVYVCFCKKCSKIKACCFQFKSIGNLITSLTAYGIPYSNIISRNGGQNSYFFLLKYKTLNFFTTFNRRPVPFGSLTFGVLELLFPRILLEKGNGY